MATKTLGTNGTTTLTAVQWPGATGTGTILSAADIASIANSILDDQVPAQKLTQRIWPGAFQKANVLYVPGRGFLKVFKGDWIAVDPTGWPILISGGAIPSTLTAAISGGTNGTPGTVTFAASVLALGWRSGMAISGTNIAAAAVITAISANGLTVTCNTSGTPSGTATVSSWTHT